MTFPAAPLSPPQPPSARPGRRGLRGRGPVAACILLGLAAGCAAAPANPDPWGNGNWRTVRDRADARAAGLRESLRHMERGQRELADGRVDAAEDDFRMAIDASEHNAAACDALAELLSQQRRYEEAMTWHRRAVSLQPEDGAYLNRQGITEVLMGQPSAAVASFDSVLARSSHSSAVHMNKAWALFDLDDTAGALASARESVRVEPLDAEHHNDLGFLLYSVERYDEAAGPLRRATELAPELAAAHHNLGRVFTRTGQGELARAAYGRAVELEADNATYRRSLGLEEARAGRNSAARRELGKALELSPYNAGLIAELAALGAARPEDAVDVRDPSISSEPLDLGELWDEGGPSRAESVPDLIDMLDDADWKVRHRAKVALIARGSEALPHLRAAADASASSVADMAAQIARTIEAAEASEGEGWNL